MTSSLPRQTLVKRLLIALELCCIAAILLMYGYLNFQGFARYCNADVYADSQVSMRIWEQKDLFPEGWQFSNQFYIAATPNLTALLYGLTGSINTGMVLATEVMTVLLFLSFFWLLRTLTHDTLLQTTACLVLLAANVAPYGPYSVNSMLFFTQASFYACYLITVFVVFGDYIRAYQAEGTRPVAWGLSLILSFAMGMQSLRQTVVMVLPILCCELFVTFRRALLHKKAWNRGTLVRSISYALANVAGAVVIKLLDPPSNPFFGEMALPKLQEIPQRIPPLGAALSEITSLDYVMNGECSRLMSMIILGFVLLAGIGAVLWLIRIHKEETPLELCWLLLAVGILGVLLSTVVLTITIRGIYLFMWFPLVACSVVLLMEKFPNLLKYAMALLLCGVSLLGMRDSYGIYIDILKAGNPTDTAQLCQWAVEEDYEYIYGDYWGTATQIAVYSDGELKAGCWHTPENVFYVEMANNPQDIYGEAENEKAIYVFTSEDEAAGLAAAEKRGVTMTKVAEFGDCKAYTSPVQLMRHW